MFTSVEGVYRDGKVELLEVPSNLRDEMRVIVTFIKNGPVDLQERGIDAGQAAELRARLATFTEEWGSPEMDIYNDYDAVKSRS